MLTSDAVSLNPPADYKIGQRGHAGFMRALHLCCSLAVAQCCQDHPLHPRILRAAKRNRARVAPLVAAPPNAPMTAHRLIGNRKARRAGLQKTQGATA